MKRERTAYPSWMKDIQKAFSGATKEFAAHPLEEGYARKILIAALRNDIGYKDYYESIRAWMKTELRDQKTTPHKHICNKDLDNL